MTEVSSGVSFRGAIIVALVAAVAVAGIAVGYGFGTTLPGTQQKTTTVAASPYVLTLVITTNNEFNSTIGDQPAYFVLGPHGLTSSMNIYLPAESLIKLVIINYDNGQANLTAPKYANVTGVEDDHVTLINNSLVNSTVGASGIQIRGVENVTSLSPGVIAHTFTIPSLGINIPVAALSTEIAYFITGNAGSYFWFCMTRCGSGADGLGGAMATMGWMSGSVVVE